MLWNNIETTNTMLNKHFIQKKINKFYSKTIANINDDNALGSENVIVLGSGVLVYSSAKQKDANPSTNQKSKVTSR